MGEIHVVLPMPSTPCTFHIEKTPVDPPIGLFTCPMCGQVVNIGFPPFDVPYDPPS